MNDTNLVVISGRLTREVETRSVSTGTILCRFDIASNKSIKDKDYGEWKDVPGYYSCIAWAKLAEYISKHATKGRAVLIEGELIFQQWENAEGKRQSKVEINVHKFRFIDGKKSENSGNPVKDGFNGESIPSDSFPEPFNDDIPF